MKFYKYKGTFKNAPDWILKAIEKRIIYRDFFSDLLEINNHPIFNNDYIIENDGKFSVCDKELFQFIHKEKDKHDKIKEDNLKILNSLDSSIWNQSIIDTLKNFISEFSEENQPLITLIQDVEQSIKINFIKEKKYYEIFIDGSCEVNFSFKDFKYLFE